MWAKQGLLRNSSIVIALVILNVPVFNFCYASASSGVKVFEGELIFNKELPVGLAAGASEYPELVKINSVSFEESDNIWEVFAKIGWLPVVDSTWKCSTEKGSYCVHQEIERLS